MTKSEMAAALNEKSAWLPGKRVKLDFGDEGVVMLDGAGNAVTEDDGPPTPRSRSPGKIGRRCAKAKLDGMTAFMQGKLKVEGDMSNAMQLQRTSRRCAPRSPRKRISGPNISPSTRAASFPRSPSTALSSPRISQSSPT
jgi:putative sterol carrier protein